MKNEKFILSAVVITAMIIITSCGGNNVDDKSNIEGESKTEGKSDEEKVPDALGEAMEKAKEDESSFGEVKIGSHIWMTKNLDITNFRNGDPIPEAKTNEEWQNAAKNRQPAWCYYDNDPKNGYKYGKLYNWYAVNDSRGMAPVGWELPSDNDWKQLMEDLGQDVGEKMKSQEGWFRDKNGTNESGFSANPGGYRKVDGTFKYIEVGGHWWSNTKNDLDDGWEVSLSFNMDLLQRGDFEKGYGMSIRCIKHQ